MSAKDFLRRNKTKIQSILSGSRKLIIGKCYEEGLITELDHVDLSSINKGTEMDYVTELINNIMGKGDKRCQEFLDLLKNDQNIKGAFPQLEDLLLNYTPSLPKPVPESSSTAKTGDVRPDTKPKSEKGELYPLNSNPTGLCFIINNMIFEDHDPRYGSDVDAEILAKVFSWLGFRVLMSKDQTKDQMDQVLKCLSAQDVSELLKLEVKEWSGRGFTDLQDVPTHGDAFICCILSHGTRGVVCGIDGERLAINDIKKMFNATELSPLTNKPKVLLIQACQGGATQGRVVLPVVQSDDLQSIPGESDFLVGMSTVEDYKAYRDPLFGSWYIQSLCKHLNDGCPSGVDMCTILERVNKEMKGKEGKTSSGVKVKQMSEFRSSLCGKLVFSPRPT